MTASTPSTLDDVPGDDETPRVSDQLKNSRWSLVTRLAFAGGALLTIIILSVSLKVDDFGRFSGVAALVAILGGLARMGAAELMLESLAARPDDYRNAFGRALGTTMASSVIGLVLVAALQPLLLPEISLFFIVSLALGEFLHVAGLDTSLRLLHARGLFRRAAAQAVTSVGLRIVAVGSLIVWPMNGLNDLGIRYLTAGVVVWLIGLVSIVPVIGRPNISIPRSGAEIRRGMSIAVGQTSLTVSTRIDQTLLLRAGLESDAGIYGFGARIVFNAMIPAQALLEVVYPDFFRAGARGGGQAHALARRLLTPLLLYGAFAAAVLVVLGPALEYVMDESFEGVALVVVAMAGFPAIRIAQSLVGDVLTGLGAHNARSRATLAAGGLNIAMNLVLIPSLGWWGAAISTYAADIFLLIVFSLAARRR